MVHLVDYLVGWRLATFMIMVRVVARVPLFAATSHLTVVALLLLVGVTKGNIFQLTSDYITYIDNEGYMDYIDNTSKYK
jgi:hypothetical protein